ncbi:hypothetical protein [Reinekea thalattae]|uniref:Uncharacterized protein n=1 Tax=Reinekea thalattae TaxID=2593301 RepID=A0A5C8Z285_9GAMM|nr:hypothetical protein [Reinekea thalattae]TXR51313.1 hypothetical protein FME95_12315 [Reinekea thalattae]
MDLKIVFKYVLSILVFMLCLTVFAEQLSIITSEAGPIEWSQNTILLLALIAWLAVTIRQRKTGSGSFSFVFSGFFSILSYGVLGRELSWLEVLGVSEHIAEIIELASIIFAVLILTLLAYIWFKDTDSYKKSLADWFKTSAFFYLLFALFFVLVGDVFEKKLIPVHEYRLYEEMAELTGYIFLLVAALCEWPLRFLQRKE